MKRCRLKRHNFQNINKMSKENKTSDKQEHGNDFIADVKRSFNFDYKFGHLSKEGYRHFPILYFSYGTNGFSLCILGATITAKLW